MIDVETRATTPNAIVLSLGAVFYDKGGLMDSYYHEFSVEDQQKRGRRSMPSTVAWWNKQVDEGKRMPGNEEANNLQQLVEFSEWVKYVQAERKQDVKVWGNGASFDIPIMESLLSVYDVEIPWKFWNVRCVRTIVDLYPESRYGEGAQSENDHNALNDAKNQAIWMIRFMEKYGI